jgi:hypothetical protein
MDLIGAIDTANDVRPCSDAGDSRASPPAPAAGERADEETRATVPASRETDLKGGLFVEDDHFGGVCEQVRRYRLERYKKCELMQTVVQAC